MDLIFMDDKWKLLKRGQNFSSVLYSVAAQNPPDSF